MLDIANDIRSLSDFKRNTSELLERLKKTGNPLVLTINGKGRGRHPGRRSLPGASRSCGDHRGHSARAGRCEGGSHEASTGGIQPSSAQAWHTGLRLRKALKPSSKSSTYG